MSGCSPCRVAVSKAHLRISAAGPFKGHTQGSQELLRVADTCTRFATEGIANDALHVALLESAAQTDHLRLALGQLVVNVGFSGVSEQLAGGGRETIGVLAVEQAIGVVVCCVRTLAWIVGFEGWTGTGTSQQHEGEHCDESG